MDPQCLSKFEYYIDNVSTAMNECIFGKKLRWLPKASHFPRYYRNGWCCASQYLLSQTARGIIT